MGMGGMGGMGGGMATPAGMGMPGMQQRAPAPAEPAVLQPTKAPGSAMATKDIVGLFNM